MRIKIVRTPTLRDVDGIALNQFTKGHFYTVGTTVGAYLIAEGWAVFAEPPQRSLPAPLDDRRRNLRRQLERRQESRPKR
jgi:hypothetical protein